MKKILVVSNMYPSEKFPSYGIFVKRFCDQLDEIGIKYNLSVMDKSTNKAEKVWNYLIFYVSTFFKCWLGCYETVYVHYASYSTPPVLLARKLRKFKFVVNAHGTDVVFQNTNQEKMGKYTALAMKISDKIVVPSLYFKFLVADRYNLDENKIDVYPSAGVNLKVFHPATSDKEILQIKEKFGLNKNNRCIGFVGRLTKAKGWETFLKAIKILASKLDDFDVIMVGDGVDEDNVEKFIKDNELSTVVRRCPLLNEKDLSCVYRVLDVMAFPSESESLGLVGLEAMASGAVVIASDFAAPKYYICDNVNGLKFPVGDVNGLSDKIISYFNMGMSQQASIRKEGMKTAGEFSAENMVVKLESIIHDYV